MAGGALGSAARYIAMSIIGKNSAADFPYGTLAVNIIGSFLMGAWIAYMANLLPERGKNLHLLFAVGVLGGFTTFSSFSLDVFYLYERGETMQAALYIISSILLSIAALFFGVWLIKFGKI